MHGFVCGLLGEGVEGGHGGRLVALPQNVSLGAFARRLHVLETRRAQELHDQVQLQTTTPPSHQLRHKFTNVYETTETSEGVLFTLSRTHWLVSSMKCLFFWNLEPKRDAANRRKSQVPLFAEVTFTFLHQHPTPHTHTFHPPSTHNADLLDRTLRLEQDAPTEQLGEDAADRPDVDGRRVVLSAHEELGRPVVLRHHLLRQVPVLVWLLNPRQSEVTDLEKVQPVSEPFVPVNQDSLPTPQRHKRKLLFPHSVPQCCDELPQSRRYCHHHLPGSKNRIIQKFRTWVNMTETCPGHLILFRTSLHLFSWVFQIVAPPPPFS